MQVYMSHGMEVWKCGGVYDGLVEQGEDEGLMEGGREGSSAPDVQRSRAVQLAVVRRLLGKG